MCRRLLAAQDAADDCQQDGIRHTEPPCRSGKDGDQEQKEQKEQKNALFSDEFRFHLFSILLTAEHR